MQPYNILIADDEDNVRKLLSLVLQENGYYTLLAKNGKEALERFQTNAIDLVLLDIRMPELDGLQVLKTIKQTNSDTPIILMTAYAGVDTAVEAIKKGAFDYIIKPFDLEDLQVLVAKALHNKNQHKSDSSILDKLELYDEEGKPQKILTNSPIMMELCRNIAKVSQTNATVLITGESGTGKELVAKAIHYYSQRSSSPFIKVNCGALSESLLESTLFGHEKGAFTGAIHRQQGLFERANHGTLLLDEVGEMSTNLQVKLLRVLQEKEFESIGGKETIHTDFRLIAATNRNLQALIEENKFRLDLFYRLNVMSISLPPLRDRPEDIALLGQYFVKKFCIKHAQSFLELTDETLSILNSYTWPGNVRELSNVIEHAVIMSTGAFIHPDDLPDNIIGNKVVPTNEKNSLAHNQPLKETIKKYERDIIAQALIQNDGNRERTAKVLGISKRSLIYKIQEYQLDL